MKAYLALVGIITLTLFGAILGVACLTGQFGWAGLIAAPFVMAGALKGGGSLMDWSLT